MLKTIKSPTEIVIGNFFKPKVTGLQVVEIMRHIFFFDELLSDWIKSIFFEKNITDINLFSAENSPSKYCKYTSIALFANELGAITLYGISHNHP